MSDSVYSALLISSKERFFDAMRGVLKGERFGRIDSSSPSGAREILASGGYDLIFVNASGGDEAVNAAVTAPECSVVLVLLGADDFARRRGELTSSGVMIMEKPASPAAFSIAVDLMCAARERLRGAERRLGRAEEKMEDLRVIDRAKWMLIGNLQMTEAEAHRFIERQAMDRCVTRRAVAENILKTYKTI